MKRPKTLNVNVLSFKQHFISNTSSYHSFIVSRKISCSIAFFVFFATSTFLSAQNLKPTALSKDSFLTRYSSAQQPTFRWEYSEDQVNWQYYSNEEYIQAPTNKTTYYRRWVALRSNPKSVVDFHQINTINLAAIDCASSIGAVSTTCGLNNGKITFGVTNGTTETNFSLEIYNPTSGQFTAYQNISLGLTENLPPGTYRIVWGGGTCITSSVTISASSIPAGPSIASVTASNQFDCIYGNMGFQVVMYAADPGLQYRINGGAWQSDPNFSGFAYGTYLFEAQTVIDATCTSGISSYQNIFSEVEPPVIQNVNLANVTDCTLNNASATVTLSQGSGIQFRINGGAWQWSNVFTNLPKGSYDIEVQTSGNITCSSGYYSFSVDETKGLQITGHTLSNLGACGTTATNVSISLRSNATAFSPSVQYKMGNGAWQSSAVFSGLSAGTYAFYIKAADGCTTGATSNYSVTISNSTVPIISSVTTSNDNDCSINNVALKVIVQDTTVGIKYRINGGAWGNSSTFTGLTSGTYLLEAAPSSNLTCIASITKTIVETGSVTISSITVANQSDCTPNNVIVTAVHNGGTQTGLEFQLVGTGVWQANNPQFTGLTSNTYSIQARVKSSTCAYPVSVKTITVTETLYPTIASDTVTGIKDCIKNNARATLRLKDSSMPAQYRITNLNNIWQTSNVFSNLTTGVYQVQVAAQGNTTCIQNYTLNVDEGLGAIDSLRVTNYNDCTNRNIQIKVNYTASPLGNIQFRINGGAYQTSPIFTGLTTGTFLVESNTANGCKSSRSTGTITEVLVPEITNLQASNDADCIVGNMNATVLYNTNGITLGAITFRLNGGPWQSGVHFTNLPSGSYLVEASSTKCFTPTQVTLNEKKPPIIQDVVITNTADTCASRLDFKVILSNFDSTQQYQYAIASGPTWQTSNQFSSQYPFSYNFLVKSTTTTCTGTSLIKDFTGAKRGAKYSSITLVNDNDCITGNMIATVYTDAIAASPTDAWYPHTRDQWFRADKGAWVQYPSALNNLSAGSHSIQVRYKNCIDSAQVTLSERIPIRVGSVAIGNQNDCIKGNATATITALNTLGSIRYALGSGAYQLSNPTFSALNSGTYLAKVLDDGGCKDSLAFSVIENEPPLASISGVNSLCAGQSTTLSATGGTAYLWSTGATTAAILITPSSNNTYTVTVTQNGCSTVATKTISVTPAPTITGVTSLCVGQSTTLTASTGSSYLWSTGATTAAITSTPSANTTYTVTVTQNGCSLAASQLVTVTPYPIPVITGATTICSGQPAALTASGGTSYLWSTGATTASISPTPLANITYSVTVSQNGCSAIASKAITITALPTPLITGVQNICAGQSTTLTASGGATYLWSTGETIAAVSLTPSATSTYTVTVTQNGCSAVTSKQVNVTPYPTISGVTSICSFQSTTLTASTGSSYSWSTGATSAAINVSPSVNTTYSVTVTQNGCRATASQQVTVTAYPSPTISGGANICAGQSTTLSVGAAAGYSYSWSTGETTSSITTTPATTTTYSVTVSQNGCASGSSKSVNVTALPTAAISGASSICTGQSTTLTASGGTTYLWSTGATTAAITATPSSSTTYTVTVTQNGCSAVATKPLSVTPLPSISGASTVCAGQPAALTASSGSAYLWSTGATTASISPIPTINTTYTVTVTQNGCTAVASKQVTVTPLPSAVITGVSSICNGQPANLTASGGTAYAWSTGATTASIAPTPSANTTYTVTVTSNGCTTTAAQVVVVKALPLVGVSGPAAVCQGQVVGLSSVYSADSYLWSNGATTPSITVPPGAYSLTVITNGCSNTAGITVLETPTYGASISGPTSICLGSTARLTASGSGAYQWSNGSTAGFIDVTPTAPGTYQYSVNSFNNGCPGTPTVHTLTVPAPLTLGYQLQNDKDCSPNNIVVIPTATNAQGAVNYIISPLGSTDFSVDLQGKGSGKYTLSGIDTKGCTASTLVDINEAQPVTLSYQLDNPDDCIKGNARLYVRTLTGNGHVAITLGGYSPPNALFTLGSGTYQFQALDSIGCSASLSVTIDEKLPTFTVTQGNLQDCDPNNTQLTINGNSARGALVYKLDQSASQTDPIFSNVPVGTHKLSLTDTKGCRDSVTVVVENNCLVDYDYKGVSSCDTTDGEIVIDPINNGGSQQFSIDKGATWTNSNNFKGLAPGNYTPAIKKLPLGCVIYGDSIAISDTCQRYAIAAFTKDTILITNPRQLVRFPWKIQTPRWMHRDSFGLKLQLKGDGAPHFIEYQVDGGSLATLRGERLFAQRLYRNGFSGLDRDSTALASTAGLFKYPQDYVFTLTSDNPNKLKVDPDHGTLRVVVLLDADPDTYSEQPLIICKGESVTLNPGLGSCFNWNDGGFQGSRTITPTHDTTYSVTILDDQLRQTIKVYHIKVVNLAVKIIPTDAQKRTCTADPVKLTAQVSGAPNAQLIQYRWNTGETTASVTISSSKPYTPATRTVTVTYAIAPGQICSAVASVDVAKLFENQDANICDNIYAKMKALGFEGFACTVIPKLPLTFPTLRGNGPITDYSHYDIASDGNNIPLAARLTKIIDILRAKGYNANGYLTDADNVCNGSEFDAVKTLFEQDLDDYDVWVHVVKCDRAGNGYYFIRLNKEIINLDDTFLALLFEDRNEIATYPVYQFILSEVNLASTNSDVEIHYTPGKFAPEFSPSDSTILIKELASGIGNISNYRIIPFPNGVINIQKIDTISNAELFGVKLFYKSKINGESYGIDPFGANKICDTLNKVKKYSFKWYINNIELVNLKNIRLFAFKEIARYVQVGVNKIKIVITNNCLSTSQNLELSLNYQPKTTSNLAIRVNKNGNYLGIYSNGQTIGSKDHGDKPLKSGDNLSIQLGKLTNQGVFDTITNGEMTFNNIVVQQNQTLNFVFRYNYRTLTIKAERNVGINTSYFNFAAQDTMVLLTERITNPLDYGPNRVDFDTFPPNKKNIDSIAVFIQHYQQAIALIKNKKKAFPYYDFFRKNHIIVKFHIKHEGKSGNLGDSNANVLPDKIRYDSLKLINPQFMNETKYINAVNTVSQNRIDTATLVSSLNKGDLEQLNIASNQKRITELSNEIIDRISSTSPNSANTIRQKIQDGSFIGSNDANGLYYYITELDAQNIYPFDSLGVVITLDAVDMTTPADIAHTLLHELAHMRWLYENRLSKLNWNIIQRDKNILNWIVGDDLLTNEMLGYCSEGPGHERGNKENSYVCTAGNLVP